MKIVRNIPIAGAVLVSVAACGGGGGAPVDIEVPSVGLFNESLPAGADFDNLPAEAQSLVTNWANVNETGELNVAPASSATFTGTFGAEIDNGPILTGDAQIVTNFDSSLVDATFSNVTAYDEVDGPVNPTGSFGATGAAVSDGRYTGTLSGTLTVDAENYNFDGSLEGAFANSGDTLGTLDGTITNPDTTVDNFSGIFLAATP